MFLRFRLLLIAVAAIAIGSTGNVAKAGTADIVFVVDESGSMSGEHAWIGTMVTQLDNALIAAGVTGNRFGLVGFGGGSGHTGGHTHLVGGAQFGSAAQLATATGGLLVNGATEDGYSGIHHATTYSFRAGAAVNIILITDEDRDAFDASLNFANTKAALQADNARLNTVVNNGFRTNTSAIALGVAGDGTWYQANGSGGFNTGSGGTTLASTTKTHYVDMAHQLGGAGWDLNQLRAGGNTANSFTKAFVDLKVQEIQEQLAPAPPAVVMALIGVFTLGGGRMLRRRQAVAAA